MLTFFPPPWQSASLENNRIARILALLNEKFRTPLNRSFQSQLKEFSLTFNHLHVSILSLFQNIVFHLVALFTFLTSSFSSFYILLKYSVYLVCVKLKFYFTNPTLYSSSWIFSADIFQNWRCQCTLGDCDLIPQPSSEAVGCSQRGKKTTGRA